MNLRHLLKNRYPVSAMRRGTGRHPLPIWRTERLEQRLLLTATPNGDDLRTYRLAVAATEEYTAFFGDDRMAAKNAIAQSVATFNEILNRELNVHLDLIDSIDIVFGPGHPDPFSSNLNAVLGENQTLLDNVIGEANYDIGHVFGTFSGGLATVNSAGINGNKAKGASGTSSPTGSSFDLLAIHEFGHQFGATHTFNGPDPARVPSTAYEPGSGSTLMSYAGILPAVFQEPPAGNNLQNTPDDYFHAGSLDQIVDHLETLDASGVGTITTAVNQIPVVSAGIDYTIPAETAFSLSATGSDADGDTLSYTFEQMDVGAAKNVDPLDPDNGSSPLFRSFEPAPADASGTFTRIFPQLSDILSNSSTKGEQLPSTTRDLNFRATVRDQQGGTSGDDVLISVVDTGSPFAITSLNSTTTLTGGSTQEITWDVAGTTAATVNGIDVSDVEILLSTDGGLSFPHSLATTANDGTHTVTLPNIDATSVRFQVRAVGNIFFDISDADVAITTNVSAPGATVTESDAVTCVGEVATVGAASDTFTIALNTTPSSAVELTISGDDDVLVSTDGTNFTTSMTLSVADTSAQTIHVRAFNDADIEGTHSGTITQTVSASADPSYPVGLLINDVIATIIDDERTPLVAVDLQRDGGTVPTNWTEINETDDVFSETTFSDLIREDGSATTFDLTIGPTTLQGNSFGSSDPATETVPIHTPSLSDAGGVLGWTRSSTNTVVANWSGLTPGEKYNVYVMVAERFGGGTDINHTVTILGDGSDDPAAFTQTTTGFGGELQINNQQGDDSQPLEDFALTVTADSGGQIDVQIVRDDGNASNVIYLSAVAIQHAVTPTSEPPVVDVVTFDAGTGRLTVNAGSNDSITISGTDGTVTVHVNGNASTQFGAVATNLVQSILINGGETANRVDLSSVSTSSFSHAGGVAITVLGGAGNDTLTGSAFGDTIDGGMGNDFIVGGSGADSLLGGAEDDMISGGSGRDTIDGGSGNDRISGNTGRDDLSGADGADTIIGGPGRDSIRAGSGADEVRGGTGSDSLFGDAGNDTIIGGAGQDSISGGDEDDHLVGSSGADGINAGAGNDVVNGLSGADTILGLTGSDTLNGGARPDILIGGDNDDDLTGAGGTDTLAGGEDPGDTFDDSNEIDETFTESMFAALLAFV